MRPNSPPGGKDVGADPPLKNSSPCPPAAPCPTRAARAAAASALPAGSAVCPDTGLSNDQAAAIAENADAITARIDAKAKTTRAQAGGRAGLAVATVAGVAWATGSPLYAAVAFFLCLLASATFLASASRQASARRAAHATVAKARAQAARACVAEPSITAAPAAFEGRWLKDNANSDSMTGALDAVNLHGLVRRAVHLIKGLELKTTSPPGVFQFGVFSVLPWFKITERHVLGGPPLRHRRRDLRRGGSTGSASLLPPRALGGQPRIAVDLAWAHPHPGGGRDTYELTGPANLTVFSEMEVVGPGGCPTRVEYTTRYLKK